MIIRMTVEDNDYTKMLEKFADNLFERLYIESSLVLNELYDPETLHRLIEIEETIRKTMWAESMDDITDEAKTLLKAKLVIIWGKYVDSVEKEDRIKEYLNYKENARYTESKEGNATIWSLPCDLALPCATQNELTLEDAKMLVKNGVIGDILRSDDNRLGVVYGDNAYFASLDKSNKLRSYNFEQSSGASYEYYSTSAGYIIEKTQGEIKTYQFYSFANNSVSSLELPTSCDILSVEYVDYNYFYICAENNKQEKMAIYFDKNGKQVISYNVLLQVLCSDFDPVKLARFLQSLVILAVALVNLNIELSKTIYLSFSISDIRYGISLFNVS